MPISPGMGALLRVAPLPMYHISDMHRTALHPHQLWATVKSDQYDEVS